MPRRLVPVAWRRPPPLHTAREQAQSLSPSHNTSVPTSSAGCGVRCTAKTGAAASASSGRGACRVVGLDVEEERGHHGHGLLARYAACGGLALNELVQLREDGHLAQLHAAEVHLPGELPRVPRHRTRRLTRLPCRPDSRRVGGQCVERGGARPRPLREQAACWWQICMVAEVHRDQTRGFGVTLESDVCNA